MMRSPHASRRRQRPAPRVGAGPVLWTVVNRAHTKGSSKARRRMGRWRIFGLTTVLSVVFLASLFLIAEAGRVRLRAASEQMQEAMSRRILVGDLRRQVAE